MVRLSEAELDQFKASLNGDASFIIDHSDLRFSVVTPEIFLMPAESYDNFIKLLNDDLAYATARKNVADALDILLKIRGPRKWCEPGTPHDILSNAIRHLDRRYLQLAAEFCPSVEDDHDWKKACGSEEEY